MNKKNNRKGFTTVELVIVIAVIAILATVLIPTFSNLIEKANESAALQEATNAVKFITLENLDNDAVKFDDIIMEIDGYYFGMINGQLVEATKTTAEGVTTYTIGQYVFKTSPTDTNADLKLNSVPYTATASNADVDDMDENKVKIYTLEETPAQGG